MDHKRKLKIFNGKIGDARLGDLLFEFFKFYSGFNFTSDVVSIRTGAVLSKDQCLASSSVVGCDGRDWEGKNFYIEEPFKRDNVAR